MHRVLLPLLASLLLCLHPLAQARMLRGTVSHVGDGDTLWVRPAGGGAPRAVRLTGIDAPELCQPHGPQARDALAARVDKRSVAIDVRGRDGFGRALGALKMDGQDVNGWLVASGHAWSQRYMRSPGPYAKEEAQARRARRGLWRDARPQDPRSFRKEHGHCR